METDEPTFRPRSTLSLSLYSQELPTAISTDSLELMAEQEEYITAELPDDVAKQLRA